MSTASDESSDVTGDSTRVSAGSDVSINSADPGVQPGYGDISIPGDGTRYKLSANVQPFIPRQNEPTITSRCHMSMNPYSAPFYPQPPVSSLIHPPFPYPLYCNTSPLPQPLLCNNFSPYLYDHVSYPPCTQALYAGGFPASEDTHTSRQARLWPNATNTSHKDSRPNVRPHGESRPNFRPHAESRPNVRPKMKIGDRCRWESRPMFERYTRMDNRPRFDNMRNRFQTRPRFDSQRVEFHDGIRIRAQSHVPTRDASWIKTGNGTGKTDGGSGKLHGGINKTGSDICTAGGGMDKTSGGVGEGAVLISETGCESWQAAAASQSQSSWLDVGRSLEIGAKASTQPLARHEARRSVGPKHKLVQTDLPPSVCDVSTLEYCPLYKGREVPGPSIAKRNEKGCQCESIHSRSKQKINQNNISWTDVVKNSPTSSIQTNDEYERKEKKRAERNRVDSKGDRAREEGMGSVDEVTLRANRSSKAKSVYTKQDKSVEDGKKTEMTGVGDGTSPRNMKNWKQRQKKKRKNDESRRKDTHINVLSQSQFESYLVKMSGGGVMNESRVVEESVDDGGDEWEDVKEGEREIGKGEEVEEVEEFPTIQAAATSRSKPLAATKPSSYSAMLKKDVPSTWNKGGKGDASGVIGIGNPVVKRKQKKKKKERVDNTVVEEKKSQAPLVFDIELSLAKLQMSTPGWSSDDPEPPAYSPSKKGVVRVTNQLVARLDGGTSNTTDRQRAAKDDGGKMRGSVANPLDSSSPLKRGKERIIKKKKKTSSLKKVILKGRAEKRRVRKMKELEEETCESLAHAVPRLADRITHHPGTNLDNTNPASSSDKKYDDATLDLSIITQNTGPDLSQILADTSASLPLSTGGQDQKLAGAATTSGNPVGGSGVKIHSRKFREYCSQVLNKEIDEECTALLQNIVRFQDRAYEKDPVKAHARRRYVLGLREVRKHLVCKHIKFIVISTNMEKCSLRGGLDDELSKIIHLSTDQSVPCVFALSRKALGRACGKPVPVSIAGILNYAGTESHYHKLMDLTRNARQAYQQMVSAAEQQARQHAQQHLSLQAGAKNKMEAVSNVVSSSAALGHSRTPSACSGISITSSLISEPISENYLGNHMASRVEGSNQEKAIFRHVTPSISSLAKQSVAAAAAGGGGGGGVGGGDGVGSAAACANIENTSVKQNVEMENKKVVVESATDVMERSMKTLPSFREVSSKERVECWVANTHGRTPSPEESEGNVVQDQE